MSSEINPFESAIAALESRRVQVNAEIDADIAKLREIGERMSGITLTPGAPLNVPTKIESDTFYNMSFPEAARKFLAMSNKRPQSTNSIIEALAQGGLKKAAYNTMYATLARRSRDFGDIVNVNGDWGLPEWYGQKAKPKKRGNGEKVGENRVSLNPKDFSDEGEEEAQQIEVVKTDAGS